MDSKKDSKQVDSISTTDTEMRCPVCGGFLVVTIGGIICLTCKLAVLEWPTKQEEIESELASET